MTTTATSPTTASSASPTLKQTTALGKDDFLKMLVMQLRNQDPMNPMSGSDFAAQLAQFSSVEQLQNINTTLQQSLDANSVLSQSINNALSATMIGKDVKASADSFNYTGTGDVSFGYSLKQPAGSVTISIVDKNGQTVRTITGSTDEGDNTLKWNGKDNLGNTVPSGQYAFKIEAKDSKGGSIDSTPYIYGTVTGVRFKSDGAVFVINGIEIPLSNILEIKEH